MFKKARDYGKAFVVGTKNALDPARMRAEMEKNLQLAFAMPNASPSTLPAMTGLAPEPPVPAADAAARRDRTVTELSAAGGPAIWLDRIHTRQPLGSHLVPVLHGVGLDPAQVYGVYPSTQLLHPRLLGQQDLWWEWCVLHTGGPDVAARIQQANTAHTSGQTPSHPAVPIVLTQMARTKRWIDRPKTAPLLFDEEAAAAVLVRAGVDPAHSYGLARLLVWGPFGDGAPTAGAGVDLAGDSRTVTPEGTVTGAGTGTGSRSPSVWRGDPGSRHGVTVQPVGVQMIWVSAIGPAGARTDPGLAGTAPIAVPDGTDLRRDLGVTVELLDWTPISLASQPVWLEPPVDPTPFPLLPASPEELAMAYLRIVGVSPADCYGVAVTVIEQQSAFIPAGTAGADRGQAASMISLVYRERPEHADGRRRFEQYRASELRTDLTVRRQEIATWERVATSGLKMYVRSQVPGDLYDELGGDEMYDQVDYPYLFGSPPTALDQPGI